jgi:hypothetical protein
MKKGDRPQAAKEFKEFIALAENASGAKDLVARARAYIADIEKK